MTKLLAACVIAVVGFIAPANAQSFPNKLIRIIVPFTPGGSNDVVAREIATGLQTSLNQTTVVENKPGGGGDYRLFLRGEVAAGRARHADRAGFVHHGTAPVAQSGL